MCIHRYQCGPVVDFTEGGKLEYPEKNPQSTGEIKYEDVNLHESLTYGRRRPEWLSFFFGERYNYTVLGANRLATHAFGMKRLSILSFYNFI